MEKFTRSTIQKILRGAGLDFIRAREATARIIDALAAALAAEESVELRGFGSLEVRERKAYRTHNPKTGEAVDVPPRRRIVFHAGRDLKTALRGKSIPPHNDA